MWLFILSCRRFEETFDNAQWKKSKPLQPIWLKIQTFKDTFENRNRWKAQQMQPMCICILTRRRFKETFEKDTFQKKKTYNAASVTLHPQEQAIWGEIWQRTAKTSKTMQPVWLYLLSSKFFEETYEEAHVEIDGKTEAKLCEWSGVKLRLQWVCKQHIVQCSHNVNLGTTKQLVAIKHQSSIKAN